MPSSSRAGPLSHSPVQTEAEVTRELYAEYSGLREDLFAQLRRAHPDLPALDLLGHAQTILDRVLFLAFAEWRELLPKNLLAVVDRDEHDPEPLWHHVRAALRSPVLDGGLFRPVEPIDRLEVSDEVCDKLVGLARRDFRDGVSIDVLGHVFEQSIGDLEALRRRAGGADPEAAGPSKRHDEGVYYTPAHLTRYIVDRTLGRTLAERRRAIFDRIKPEDREARGERVAASIEAWEAYREALEEVRVLDPACGAGAFLMAAHDALGREYDRVDGELAELRGGQGETFDPDEAVLDANLFGVDLDAGSVEVTRLSLWLKSAQRGRRPRSLGRDPGNIRWGDSIVGDPDASRAAFDWARGQTARPLVDAEPGAPAPAVDALWPRGFDVVIGNPPYVRHELFTHLKGHLGQAPHGYAAYHGMADLYVYFFERGLSVLVPHGRLGYVVSNKWLRAGYAAPLRALLAGRTEIESLIDFGHAAIFEGADTSPCVIVLRKLPDAEAPSPEHALSVTAFPRSALENVDIAGYVASHRHAVPQRRLGQGPWCLEPETVESLLGKIQDAGAPLSEYARVKPHYGIKTGCNEAFIVDGSTRGRLVERDPACASVLKPLLRGQDMGRWRPTPPGLWMLHVPWDMRIERFPSILGHLQRFRAALEGRAEVKAGRFPWYALSRYASDYVGLFSSEKIVYQVIQFRPAYGLDGDGLFLNDKGFFIPSSDPWLLAVLNSPLMWWHNWRYLGHMKDEALNPAGVKMERLPIAAPDDEARRIAEAYVPQLVAFAKEDQEARSSVLDALRTRMRVETPGQKIEAFEALSPDDFLAEVKRRRPRAAGKLEPADLGTLRAIHAEHAVLINERRARALAMERRLADLVDRAYGLTPEEVALLWATAPPRMPVGR